MSKREVTVGTKRNPDRYDVDLSKLDQDEPFFILRGNDELAAELVELWGIHANTLNVNHDKVLAAYHCAEDMRRWNKRKVPD
jgi:hypothetical protein